MTTVIAILMLGAASPQLPVTREPSIAAARAPKQATQLSHVEKNRILIRLAESPAVQYGKVDYEKQSASQSTVPRVSGQPHRAALRVGQVTPE